MLKLVGPLSSESLRDYMEESLTSDPLTLPVLSFAQELRPFLYLAHSYVWGLIVRAVCLSQLVEVVSMQNNLKIKGQELIDCSNKYRCGMHGNELRTQCVHFLTKHFFYDSFISLTPTLKPNILTLSQSDNTSLPVCCFKSLKGHLINEETSLCN